MTIYFMGGEAGAFIPADSDAIEDTTPSWSSWPPANYSFSRCALALDSGASYWITPSLGSLTSAYVHGYIGSRYYAAGTQYPLIITDGSDAEYIRLNFNQGTSTLSLQYKDAVSAWQTAGSITIGMNNGSHDMDLYFECNSATADLKLFIAGTERITATVDLSHVSSLSKVKVKGGGFGSRCSQFVVADEPTIGWRLMTAYPSGVGANSDWTGSYTSVDETSGTSGWDADFIFSDTNGDVSTFALTTVGGLTGYTVRAVGVSARAKKGASGPSNLQLVLRSGGTDYTSSSQSLSVGYGAHVAVWEQDPNTSADWLNASISSLQAGVKAIT